MAIVVFFFLAIHGIVGWIGIFFIAVAVMAFLVYRDTPT
jgi:hypothetical protein